MKRVSLYLAVVVFATLAFSANAMAGERHEGHGQYHRDRVRDRDHRDFRDHDRDGARAERRERERREWAVHHDRDRDHDRQHREWARNRGHNGHDHDANWRPSRQTATVRPARNDGSNYRGGKNYRRR